MKKTMLFISMFCLSHKPSFSSELKTNDKIENQSLKLEILFEGSDVIWGFDFISDHEIIFSERDGKLKYLDLKTKKNHEVKGAPEVFAKSQGGLLDVLFDKKEGTLYLTYADPDKNGATTSLFKGKLSIDKKTIVGSRIFMSNAHAKDGIHFGSRLLIAFDDNIFMTVGERNEREKAQDLSKHNGKILRLTKEGKAPADNPFVGQKNALPEIWSYGHRNPQGILLNKKGDLLEVEFGPRGGDEINLIIKGKNYGWPVATYGKEYWGPKIGKNEVSGTVQPLKYWVPSISPSGIVEYKGDAFKGIKGNYFLATLAGSHIHRVVFDDHYKMIKEEKLLESLEDRFRQVKEGPEGFIYISTDSGKLIRVSPDTK